MDKKEKKDNHYYYTLAHCSTADMSDEQYAEWTEHCRENGWPIIKRDSKDRALHVLGRYKRGISKEDIIEEPPKKK